MDVAGRVLQAIEWQVPAFDSSEKTAAMHAIIPPFFGYLVSLELSFFKGRYAAPSTSIFLVRREAKISPDE